MGNKGVSKRKPKQNRAGPAAPETVISAVRGASKDKAAPQAAVPAPKAAEKSKPAGGNNKSPKKR